MEEVFICSYGVVNCPICMRPRRKIKSQIELAKITKRLTETVIKGMSSGRVKFKVTPNGGVAFDGITPMERYGLSDETIYRNLMAEKLPPVVAAMLERAEQLAGRKVDPKVVVHVVSNDRGFPPQRNTNTA